MGDNPVSRQIVKESIEAETITPLEAIEWMELVSDGNPVKDKAIAVVKKALI
jgi:hypothetical protein